MTGSGNAVVLCSVKPVTEKTSSIDGQQNVIFPLCSPYFRGSFQCYKIVTNFDDRRQIILVVCKPEQNVPSRCTVFDVGSFLLTLTFWNIVFGALFEFFLAVTHVCQVLLIRLFWWHRFICLPDHKVLECTITVSLCAVKNVTFETIITKWTRWITNEHTVSIFDCRFDKIGQRLL